MARLVNKIKLNNLFLGIHRINSFVKARPLSVAVGVGTIKYGLSDYIIQTQTQNKNWETMDYKRLFFFVSWGCLYVGAFQHQIYCKLYPHLFGKMNFYKRSTAAFMTDMTIHSLFVCHPIFYVYKDIIYNQNISIQQTKESLTTYKNNFISDTIRVWKVWGPAQVLTFSVIPVHFRIPWIGFVGFCYGMLLSFARGGPS